MTDKQLIPAKIRFNLILAGKEDKKTESRNSLFLFCTLNCLRVHRWWSRGELNSATNRTAQPVKIPHTA